MDELIPKPTDPDVSGVALAAREDAAVKAGLVIAKEYPRSETASVERIRKSCQRASFADSASYSFPRGGSTVRGPSVYFAREAARCWGNIDYGVSVLGMHGVEAHIEGYAVDLETNTRVAAQGRFRLEHQRKDKRSGETRWVKADERDRREIVNKHGAMLVRNCLLQLLPHDVVEDAQKWCEGTMRAAAHGDLEKSKPEVVRGIVAAFDGVDVSLEMLETNLGHKVDDIDGDELAELRRVWKSIDDGNTKRGDHFDVKDEPPPSESKLVDTVKADVDLKAAQEKLDAKKAKDKKKAAPKQEDLLDNPVSGEGEPEH